MGGVVAEAEYYPANEEREGDWRLGGGRGGGVDGCRDAEARYRAVLFPTVGRTLRRLHRSYTKLRGWDNHGSRGRNDVRGGTNTLGEVTDDT